jgi:hypothetical protein
LTTLFFDFYGIAGVEINSSRQDVIDFFAAEYAFHRVGNLNPSQPCVVLNFLTKAPKASNWSVQQHKLLARWSYLIDLSEDKVILHVAGNDFAIPMIHHMMVHSGLRYLVSYQQSLLLHSGAVAINGQSVLFTGRGGAGKTTSTSLLLSNAEQGWALHADDFIFLQPGRRTLAYLTRAHLYRDLLKWIPDLKNRLNFSERVRLEVFGRIRQWSGERIKWPVRIGVNRLWPGRELCQQATPAALVLLKRGDIPAPELLPIQPDAEVVEGLLEMNFYEARHFQKLLQTNLSPSRADPLIAAWREREQNILEAWIQQVPVYQLVLPTRRLPREQMARQVNEQISALIQPTAAEGLLEKIE